jgi:5-methylcytosine-specific restriction endonuclease McrA
MRTYVLTHVPDDDLLSHLDDLVARGCENTAETLAHIAEVDQRGLYLSRGYPSMFAYCVDRLHFSESAAFRRIHAARVARQFPALFDAVADGRLNLTSVRLLSAYLTSENLDELTAAAAHRRTSEVKELIAKRFPQPEFIPDLVPAVTPIRDGQAPVPTDNLSHVPSTAEPARAVMFQSEQAPEPARGSRARVVPVSEDRVKVELFVTRSTYEKMRYAQELGSHSMSASGLAELFDEGLDAVIEKREKRKFAATSRPRTPVNRPGSKRYVPAHVYRAVWKRDDAQCTFVSQDGHRCGERNMVEFDHMVPVALGGRATMESMRLRCRAHNQYEAERVFGRDFMQRKRDQARVTRASTPPADDTTKDLMAGLRELGVGVEMARRAIEYSRKQGGRTLEERMKAALQFLCPRGVQMKKFAMA